MLRTLIVVVIALACSTVAISQKPCQAIPLQMGLNLGDTSTSSIVGLGASDPYYTPAGFCTDNLSKEVWYSWTAPGNGFLQAWTCPGYLGSAFAAFDTALAVWGGTLCTAPLALITCNNDGPFTPCDNSNSGASGYGSLVTVAVTAGTNYWMRINGFDFFGEGAYGLFARYVPNVPFTLSLTRPSPNLLQVDIANGSPQKPYFTVVSFEAPNQIPAYYGQGWWFGLHVSLSELMLQYSINSPPFRGTLDFAGGMSMSLTYPPAFVGVEMAAVTVTLSTSFGFPSEPTTATDVALFYFY